MNFRGILFVIIVMMCFVLVHESTHAIIFDYYGCKNIETHYIPKGNAFAYTTAECLNNDNVLAQSIVDAIGYQLGVVVVLLAALYTNSEQVLNERMLR